LSFNILLPVKRIIKGKPYLIEYPSGLDLPEDGGFLGEEIFLIKTKGKLGVIFLSDNYERSYKLKDKVINIAEVNVVKEKFKSQIFLEDLQPDQSSFFSVAGVSLLSLVLIFLGCNFLKTKFYKLRRRKLIEKALNENNFQLLLKTNEAELDNIRSFITENIYKKEWETSLKDDFENLKKEYLNV
tara:strand:- start:1444 stop:1998 length:555 start_codon:yes stop_codon:yes gene_type:complete